MARTKGNSEKVISVINHPTVKQAYKASQYASLDSKTFAAYLEKADSHGIFRYDINQLANDDGGTVSGRFSIGYMQQVPNHDNHFLAFGEDLYPRRCVVELEGECLEADAQQIEYRFFAHYAENKEVLDAYAADPRMSFHRKTEAMLKRVKEDIVYSHVKNYNFACVAHDTSILTADLQWVSAGSLKKGDRLFAFNEHGKDEGRGRAKARRWEVSTVLHNEIQMRECFQLLMENGDEVICTTDHPWLVSTGHKPRGPVWMKAHDLIPGVHKIVKYIEPWDEDRSWESGWLAGFFDGEGCVNNQGSLSCNQNKGPILEFAHTLLQSKTQQVNRNQHTGGSTEALWVGGSVHDRLKFLGQIRPQRLLYKFVDDLDGRMAQVYENVEVVAIRKIGLHPIAALGTTSRTYIANGYAAHNTMYGAKIIKLAVMMGFITEDEGAEIRAAQRWDDPRLAIAKEIEAAYKKIMPEKDMLLNRAAHLAKPFCDDFCKKGDQLHRDYPHRGYVMTIAGRRSRFDSGYKTYIALNRVLQGGAADWMKKKLAILHKARRDTGLLLRLTVHDAALGRAYEGTKQKVQEILDTQVFPLKVPILSSVHTGRTWADCKG